MEVFALNIIKSNIIGIPSLLSQVAFLTATVIDFEFLPCLCVHTPVLTDKVNQCHWLLSSAM